MLIEREVLNLLLVYSLFFPDTSILGAVFLV